jgi:hypothetical protein
MHIKALMFALFTVTTTSLGFVGGVAKTRQIMVDTAESLATHPVNSFTKCLTESWEQTGELGEWRGRRKWVLTEDRQ